MGDAPTRTLTRPDGTDYHVPICGAPCHYGGTSAARKYSRVNLGWMWHCNQRVSEPGQRCYRHREEARRG